MGAPARWAIDPSNPDIVFVGTSAGIYKSTDAAATWSAVNVGLATTYGINSFVDRQVVCSDAAKQTCTVDVAQT